MSKLPAPALSNLQNFLPKINVSGDKDVNLHYCIARQGPKGKPQAVFGRKATMATLSVLKKLYKDDDQIDTTQSAKWVYARGAIQIHEKVITLIPAKQGNQITAPAPLRQLFKDLKASVTGRKANGAPLSLISSAEVARPADTSQLKVTEVEAVEGEEEDTIDTTDETQAPDDKQKLHSDVEWLMTEFENQEQWMEVAHTRANDGDNREAAAGAVDLKAGEDELLRLRAQVAVAQQKLKKAAFSQARYGDSIAALEDLDRWIVAAIKRSEARRADFIKTSTIDVNEDAEEKLIQLMEEWLVIQEQVLQIEADWGSISKTDALFLDSKRKKEAETVTNEVAASLQQLRDIKQKIQIQAGVIGKNHSEYDAFAEAKETAIEHIATLQEIYERLEVGSLMVRMRASKEGMAQARSELPKKLKEDPQFLEKLAKQPGGNELIDGLMQDYQDQFLPFTATDRKVMKAAFGARYGITEMSVGGVFTELPKLYKVMGMVPPSHTKNNTRLMAIRYDALPKASDYGDDDNKMTLHLPPSGKVLNGVIDAVTSKLMGAIKSTNFYKHTTLHEIGHAVDAKLGFMANHTSPDYGGWRKETGVGNIAIMVGKKTKFFDEVNVSYTVAESLLTRILSRRDVESLQTNIQKDAEAIGVIPNIEDVMTAPSIELAQQLIIDNKDVVWNTSPVVMQLFNANKDLSANLRDFIEHIHHESAAHNRSPAELAPIVHKRFTAMKQKPAKISDLLKHPAVAFCKKLMVSGDDGLWDKGDSAAKTYALGDMVYHESYENTWWGYKLSARDKKVSNYQFRSPDEWFSEIYACYYTKKLDPSHADYAWMQEIDQG